MVAPIVAAAGAGVAKEAAKALTGDLAVIRWQTKPKTKRGRKRAPKDVELHVNPIGVGIGAVALGGAAILAGGALWLAGLGANVERGKTVYRTIRKASDSGTAGVGERWVMYTARGIPVAQFDHRPKAGECISENEQARGWRVTGFKTYTTYSEVALKNDAKARLTFGSRGRWGDGFKLW